MSQNDPLIAFEHASGFSTTEIALTIAGICTALLMFWLIWTYWSGFKGMKEKRVGKEKFRQLVFRAIFIFLVLQGFFYFGV